MSLLESLFLHGLYEVEGAHLVWTHLLAFVATHALPYVQVRGRLVVSQAVVHVGLCRVELGVVLGRTAVPLYDAADPTAKADLGCFLDSVRCFDCVRYVQDHVNREEWD